MPKFIRTKDGRIVDTTKYPEHPASWGVQASDYALTIKQSENLAELCDGFVIDDKRNNVHYLMDYDDVIEEIYCGRIYEKDVVYGAIWTDKGLIYVAKMNDKGELVLI